MTTPPPPAAAASAPPHLPAYPAALEDEDVDPCTGLVLSAEEFLRLPPDPTLDRWLIDGVLWEQPMTVRSRPHTAAEFSTAGELSSWIKTCPAPRPVGGSGEVGVRLPGAETVLGIDLAVFDAETAAAQPPPPDPGEGMHVWHGVPLLAVEILSPTDREREWVNKVRAYLAAGVPQVWVLSPLLRTVTVHRAAGKPALHSGDDTIPGAPDLPGPAGRADDLFGP